MEIGRINMFAYKSYLLKNFTFFSGLPVMIENKGTITHLSPVIFAIASKSRRQKTYLRRNI